MCIIKSYFLIFPDAKTIVNCDIDSAGERASTLQAYLFASIIFNSKRTQWWWRCLLSLHRLNWFISERVQESRYPGRWLADRDGPCQTGRSASKDLFLLGTLSSILSSKGTTIKDNNYGVPATDLWLPVFRRRKKEKANLVRLQCSYRGNGKWPINNGSIFTSVVITRISRPRGAL